MMAHNKYRNHQVEGNEEAAEKARTLRNKYKRKYEAAKKEFYQTKKEERKIQQIMADSETKWELVQ